MTLSLLLLFGELISFDFLFWFGLYFEYEFDILLNFESSSLKNNISIFWNIIIQITKSKKSFVYFYYWWMMIKIVFWWDHVSLLNFVGTNISPNLYAKTIYKTEKK